MGLFGKTNCPICNKEVGALGKSVYKYNSEYICSDCYTAIYSTGHINNYKNIELSELKKLVKDTPRVNRYSLKAMTGQSYTNFVRDIKMKAAMKLQQENPNIRISDLAYAVGFSDPKYFSACFKKYYGKLPSEIIEEKPNKNPDNKENS